MRTRRGETVDDAHVELTAESSHVKEGFYYTRMKRFYDAFDREQIKIYLFDEFRRTRPKSSGICSASSASTPASSPTRR